MYIVTNYGLDKIDILWEESYNGLESRLYPIRVLVRSVTIVPNAINQEIYTKKVQLYFEDKSLVNPPFLPRNRNNKFLLQLSGIAGRSRSKQRVILQIFCSHYATSLIMYHFDTARNKSEIQDSESQSCRDLMKGFSFYLN